MCVIAWFERYMRVCGLVLSHPPGRAGRARPRPPSEHEPEPETGPAPPADPLRAKRARTQQPASLRACESRQPRARARCMRWVVASPGPVCPAVHLAPGRHPPAHRKALWSGVAIVRFKHLRLEPFARSSLLDFEFVSDSEFDYDLWTIRSHLQVPHADNAVREQ